jgi:predicted neuraminidase
MILTGVIIFLLLQQQKTLDWAFIINNATSTQNAPALFTETPLTTDQPYNHASSLIVQENNPNVVWVGGQRELGNVSIYHANNDNMALPLFNKDLIEHAESRFIYSIGNPIIVFYHNELWLFFTSTIGGWSTASINFMISKDQGATWSAPKQLILSPLINITNNLKGAPVFFEDGTLGLPIYSEFGSNSAKLLRMDSEGHVLSLQRISWDRCTIEPFVIPMNTKTAYALLRPMNCAQKKAVITATFDGGQSWQPLGFSVLPNDSNEISGVNMDGSHILAAFNNAPQGRSNLSFAILDTKLQPLCIIPFKDKHNGNYAYPYLLHQDGKYWMSFTNEHQIGLVHFNDTWLKQEWQKCIKP